MTDSEQTRFHIKLPDGWENQTIYTYAGPDEDDNPHIMTLAVDPYAGDVPLDEYAAEHLDLLAGSLPGFELLKDEDRVLPGGRQVHEYLIKWIPGEDTIRFRKQFFLINSEVGYSFSANFTKKTLKTVGTQMEQIVGTFQPGAEATRA